MKRNIFAKVFKENRPWGNFVQYAFNEQCTVKILTVEKGQRLSLQSHKKRDELWIMLDDGLMIELNDISITPGQGEEVYIPKGVKHRLSAPNSRGRVLEVSFGEFDENDEIRYEDDYNRT